MSQTEEIPDSAEDAQLRMMEMIGGSLWILKSLYVVAELDIADCIADDGPMTSRELADISGAHAPALYRVLRALASVGVFREDKQSRFSLTPLAETLKRGPGSLRGMALMWGAPWHLQAWNGFSHSVCTGESGWRYALGKDPFPYLAEHPEEAAVFNDAMGSFSGPEAAAVAEAYDFSGIRCLVDIAGGHGLLLATILKENPGLQGILFDQPHVVDGAAATFSDAGVEHHCKTVSGNFFESVPAGGDAYILKHIIHDWDDDTSIKILKNIRKVMPDDGKLLVVQEVLPSGNTPSIGKLLDLQMLLIGGQERTEEEYRSLYDASGFELMRIVPTRALVHIIEGKPR